MSQENQNIQEEPHKRREHGTRESIREIIRKNTRN